MYPYVILCWNMTLGTEFKQFLNIPEALTVACASHCLAHVATSAVLTSVVQQLGLENGSGQAARSTKGVRFDKWISFKGIKHFRAFKLILNWLNALKIKSIHITSFALFYRSTCSRGMGILFTRCFPRIASSLWGASIETPAILHKTCGVLPHLQLFQYARNVNECESWYTTVVQYTHYKESMKMGSNSSPSSMHWYVMICWALYILP